MSAESASANRSTRLGRLQARSGYIRPMGPRSLKTHWELSRHRAFGFPFSGFRSPFSYFLVPFLQNTKKKNLRVDVLNNLFYKILNSTLVLLRLRVVTATHTKFVYRGIHRRNYVMIVPERTMAGLAARGC